ncbi:MAG: NTP transferase domain-containing protein [Phycisphaeraceae bacterium]|nr:NTP transferase domain-containing protein [Phycisphaeraceae bacterium]
MTTATRSDAPAAIILAAGKGTRMKSDLPKVCHPIGGRAMVCAVVDACREAGCGKIVVVVGYKQELVREALAGYSGLAFALQEEQLGTGHAVLCAQGFFEGVGQGDSGGTGEAREVFVLCGDGPLIRASTLRKVLDRHRATGASATLATSVIADPTGYGRVVRDETGKFVGIVEQKNATPAQLLIREVNPSYYCFEPGALFSALSRVERNQATGEYYVTDVPTLLMADGRRVEVIDAVPPEDVLSINTLEHLAEVDRIYRSRGGA